MCLTKIWKALLPAAVFCVILCGCSGRGKGDGNGVPDNFGTIGDAGRMAYMMRTVAPDSVARFLCDASLGRLEWARIDSVPAAALYVYEHYNDDVKVGEFNDEFDRYMASLPLKDKMRMYLLSGKSSLESVGYDLGLEYVGNIREKGLKVKDVDGEIADFRKACGDDKETYNRFVKGFKTVLTLDHGHDLPEDIYRKFSVLEAE